jgi:protease II
MSSDEIRELKYISWKDPQAWMETMKGKRWHQLLKNERQHFHKLTNQAYVQRLSKKFKNELAFAKNFERQEIFKIGNETVFIALYGKFIIWRWKWSRHKFIAFDIDVTGDAIWYTTPFTQNQVKLVCQHSDGRIIWEKKYVSEEVAIIGDLCYYISTVDYFKTIEVKVCNALTGKDEHVVFIERDPQRYINLIKCADKTLFIKSIDSGCSRLYIVEGTTTRQLDHNTDGQMPLGRSMGYKDMCRLTRTDRKSGKCKYEQKGYPFSKWILPDGFVEWINLQGGYVITIKHGQETLWKCGINMKPVRIHGIPCGTMVPNPWSIWENQIMPQFFVLTPESEPYLLSVYGTKSSYIPLLKSPFPKLHTHSLTVKSLDGTHVSYCIVHNKNIHNPVALLVVGYGAYGSSTVVNWPYIAWAPLLINGWAIAFAFVRGGGDDSYEWTEAARRENRHKSIEDFEAVIQSAQHITKTTSKNTVIYGRSAGGLLVGAVAARHPTGRLMSAVYTEVPYVDILRTSTNPDLPLTVGEYNEFGNPAKRVLDFREMLAISPMDNLPIEGADGLFVLARTGLLDKQVFAYEPFKWIQRLRGTIPACTENKEARGKYIAYETNEDHVYSVDKKYDARAIDLAILEAWRTENLRQNS